MPDQAYREIQVTDTFAVSPGFMNGTSQALKGKFNGTTAPASPTAYMTWYDTTSGLKKERNAANNAWIVVGLLGAVHDGNLPLSGGTMTGDISMGTTRRITNLAAPSAAGDAARKTELDLKAPLASPVFTGDATLSVDPPGDNSLTRRIWTEGRYLKLSGGTMTGALVLSGNAATDLQAVPRQQVRDFVLFHTTTGHRHDGTDSRKIKGASLDSEASAAGFVPVSNGSSLTTWNQVGAGSIASSAVSQAKINTSQIEIQVVIGSTPSEVEVAITLSSYSFIPELKHSQATGKTLFQGVSNVGTTYGINLVQLRGEVIPGTLFARFRQVAA